MLLVLVVVVAVGAVVSYNRFVSQKTLIKDAWANIDTELRRRYDLIPNLVETVKGYASHEKEVLENVTRARAMAASATGSPAEQAAAEGPLVAALRQLMLVVENYPNLKADQNFLQLQGELTNTEDRLQTVTALLQRERPRLQPARQAVPVDDRGATCSTSRRRSSSRSRTRSARDGAPQVDFGAPTGSGAPLAGETPSSTPSATPSTPPPPADDVPEPPGQPAPPNPAGLAPPSGSGARSPPSRVRRRIRRVVSQLHTTDQTRPCAPTIKAAMRGRRGVGDYRGDHGSRSRATA